jgi:hypothetical protein
MPDRRHLTFVFLLDVIAPLERSAGLHTNKTYKVIDFIINLLRYRIHSFSFPEVILCPLQDLFLLLKTTTP